MQSSMSVWRRMRPSSEEEDSEAASTGSISVVVSVDAAKSNHNGHNGHGGAMRSMRSPPLTPPQEHILVDDAKTTPVDSTILLHAPEILRTIIAHDSLSDSDLLACMRAGSRTLLRIALAQRWARHHHPCAFILNSDAAIASLILRSLESAVYMRVDPLHLIVALDFEYDFDPELQRHQLDLIVNHCHGLKSLALNYGWRVSHVLQIMNACPNLKRLSLALPEESVSRSDTPRSDDTAANVATDFKVFQRLASLRISNWPSEYKEWQETGLRHMMAQCASLRYLEADIKIFDFCGIPPLRTPPTPDSPGDSSASSSNLICLNLHDHFTTNTSKLQETRVLSLLRLNPRSLRLSLNRDKYRPGATFLRDIGISLARNRSLHSLNLSSLDLKIQKDIWTAFIAYRPVCPISHLSLLDHVPLRDADDHFPVVASVLKVLARSLRRVSSFASTIAAILDRSDVVPRDGDSLPRFAELVLYHGGDKPELLRSVLKRLHPSVRLLAMPASYKPRQPVLDVLCNEFPDIRVSFHAPL